MTTPVDRIVDLFGGLTPMARALGHRHPSTVQGWKARGVIPARQQAQVLEAAKRHGVPLQPADFFAEGRAA